MHPLFWSTALSTEPGQEIAAAVCPCVHVRTNASAAAFAPLRLSMYNTKRERGSRRSHLFSLSCLTFTLSLASSVAGGGAPFSLARFAARGQPAMSAFLRIQRMKVCRGQKGAWAKRQTNTRSFLLWMGVRHRLRPYRWLKSTTLPCGHSGPSAAESTVGPVVRCRERQ